MANKPSGEGSKKYGKQILFKHGKGSSGMTHAGTTTDRTDVDIIIPDFFQHFIHWQTRQHGLKTLVSLNTEDDVQVALFTPVIQETIVTDFLKLQMSI